MAPLSDARMVQGSQGSMIAAARSKITEQMDRRHNASEISGIYVHTYDDMKRDICQH